ncbi:hypothetical protein O6H91_10G102800 [Diphasiastrum complanatum]|uniref:Uncharacterized protein n=1 Tax=Diphasiastrum complanatum TaxID=34168 RepID=A0ACC2CK34_DIPCM|nr:hypothetical protein O6H91_10G102800 [Diphasiastrum complanatum]
MADPPLRLLNFVSESQSQLEEARASGGARVEDGIDRPLYEILKENKDKQEAEFNDRFKHRPPKALDEDETEFLDQLEMFRKEQERQLALEEAEQLANFHVAIASRTITVDDAKAPINHTEEHKGREIQLHGEHDVPNSPMVCSSELCQLIGDEDHQMPLVLRWS